MKDAGKAKVTNTELASAEAHALLEAFAQIGKCACAILDPAKHTPITSAGWKPEWEEFTSLLPHQPERFFAALSNVDSRL